MSQRVQRRTPSTVDLAFGMSVLFILATIALVGMGFYKLVTWRPSPAMRGNSGNVIQTGQGTGVAPPPADSSPGKKHVTLRLRDIVAGLVWLSTQPALALSPAQQRDMVVLLPAVRQNVEGPPNAVDEALEGRVKAILSETQINAIIQWVSANKSIPDYMASLKRLEQSVVPAAAAP